MLENRRVFVTDSVRNTPARARGNSHPVNDSRARRHNQASPAMTPTALIQTNQNRATSVSPDTAAIGERMTVAPGE